MVEAYKRFLRNYANFNGRSTRSDYWYVVLANFLIGLAIGIIGGVLNMAGLATAISGIYSLAMIIPGIAVFVRRLHDINKSGWWFFISFVPLVGGLILLIFMCMDSVNENNKYGEIVM